MNIARKYPFVFYHFIHNKTLDYDDIQFEKECSGPSDYLERFEGAYFNGLIEFNKSACSGISYEDCLEILNVYFPVPDKWDERLRILYRLSKLKKKAEIAEIITHKALKGNVESIIFLFGLLNNDAN